MPSSDWSAIDAARDPKRFATGLDVLRAEPFFAESKARIRAVLESQSSSRIVDVGCGTGDDAAEFNRDGCFTIGLESSLVMLAEARRRHSGLPFVAGDAHEPPIADVSLDGVRADRVLQHLRGGLRALVAWRRLLRPGGCVVCFDPDLTTATIEGVDKDAALSVVAWRTSTRPGAETVRTLDDELRVAGFVDTRVEKRILDLSDLDRAEGIMGLATWGEAAGKAGALPQVLAQRWSTDVNTAWRSGTLRYTCTYILGIGLVP